MNVSLIGILYMIRHNIGHGKKMRKTAWYEFP